MREVSPHAVHCDRRFQPRAEGLTDERVSRYAYDMRRGDKFPPIKVGKVGNELCVLDGFHRVEAARTAGLESLPAQVAVMGNRMAVRVAIAANARHGLNLTGKDKRRCFALYFEAGDHLRLDGSVKSLRQIRDDLDKIAWPTTISKWLKDAGIAPSEDIENSVEEWNRDHDEHGFDLNEFDDQLHALETLFHQLEDGDRATAAGRLREFAYRIVEGEKDNPSFLDI